MSASSSTMKQPSQQAAAAPKKVAQVAAPQLMPQKRPSCVESLRAVSAASSSLTWITSSMTFTFNTSAATRPR